MKISRYCDYCGQRYMAELRYLKRNQGLFCSMSCSAKHNAKQRSPVNNTQCALCKAWFHKAPSRTSKSGLFFCTRACKDIAQRIGGMVEIQPSHYGNTVTTKYRDNVKRTTGINQCTECGYCKVPEILHVHHIDGDRSNNNLSNLIVLCPNCHYERHANVGHLGIEPRT